MAVNIVYSDIAKLDLKDIHSYIAKDSLRYAKKEVKSIRTAVSKLKLNVFIGRRFEKSDDDFSRELIFKNYRIVYDIISPTQILVLTVHHDARLIDNNRAFQDDDE